MALMRRESAESNALRRMRFSISLACLFVVVSFLMQTLIWGFASYTDIRFVRSTPNTTQRDPAVIVRENDLSDTIASSPQTKPAPVHAPSLNDKQAAIQSSGHQALDTHLQYSPVDSVLRLLYQLSIALAWIGLILLFSESTLAVVVAGGMNAPGISQVVQTQLWASLILALAVPWNQFMASFPLPSLMSNYHEMTSLAEPFRLHNELSVSTIVFFSRFLMMPLAVMGATMWIALLFHQGTAAVVEKSGPTDFEIELEEETAGRKAGSVIYGGRARGALQLTVPTDSTMAEENAESAINEQRLADDQMNSQTINKNSITLNTGTGAPVQSLEQNHSQQINTESNTTPAQKGASTEEEEPYRRPI